MRSDQLIYPKDLSKIKLGEIASCSFCFHNKYTYLSRWNDKQYGDFNFIKNLFEQCNKKKIKLKTKFIDYILTKIYYNNKIGNFGNNNI